ncbi:MAG: hypothetical protein DRH97_05110 [Chloroflexi bacterium]|nr:MAG: hypothetical protein DRH97_05110 [Chloroflexota bacterium]
MKAAVYHGPPGSWPEKPLNIEEVPAPVPGPKEVLVKVAACGLCHTDVTILRGAPIVDDFPIILGHEPSGIVTEVGAGVTAIQPGQRVIVSSNFPCLTCDECRSGNENRCANSTLIGVNCNGALAEYIVAPETGVYTIPDSLSLEESCIVADIVCTAYHAVYNRANVRPGDTVAIYGASGAIGLMCVQYASAIGATVIAIGRKKWKLEIARELGADEIISSEETQELARTIRTMTNGGVDTSLDTSGVPAMLENALRSTRVGGSIVEIALSFDKIQVSLNRLMWWEHNIMGSRTFNPTVIPKAFKLIEKGIVRLDKLVSHRFKLDQVNEAYQMLERGELIRGVVIPGD